MWKRRKALVWSLVGLLVVIGVSFILAQLQPQLANQPVYNGRTLAQWLDTASRRADVNRGNTTLQQVDVAENAIRAIGTNAFPCLLKWTRHKPSFAKRFFFGTFESMWDETPMLGWVRDNLWVLTHRREILANNAVHGFRVLHTNAFAFETLSKMASDTNNPWMQLPAAKALATVTNAPAP
jgi:hypothetical protein